MQGMYWKLIQPVIHTQALWPSCVIPLLQCPRRPSVKNSSIQAKCETGHVDLIARLIVNSYIYKKGLRSLYFWSCGRPSLLLTNLFTGIVCLTTVYSTCRHSFHRNFAAAHRTDLVYRLLPFPSSLSMGYGNDDLLCCAIRDVLWKVAQPRRWHQAVPWWSCHGLCSHVVHVYRLHEIAIRKPFKTFWMAWCFGTCESKDDHGQRHWSLGESD